MNNTYEWQEVGTLTETPSRATNDHQLRAALASAENKIINLEIALQTSRHIGAAVGIVMCRHRLSMDDAFAVLKRASQRSHQKLRDVAEWVLHTGQIDDYF